MADSRRKHLLWLQTPVAILIAVTAWRGWDSILTAVIAVAYEVILIAWQFVRAVGARSWSELRPELEAYLVSWIVGLARDATSLFRRKFNRRTIEEFNLFNVRGLGLIDTFTLDLTEVFVDLRVTPANPNAVRPATTSQLSGDQFSEGTTIWSFLRALDLQRTPRALAITGPPGSGKTTLLQYVAITFAANRQRRHRIRALTPILLFLREHAQVIVANQPSLADVCNLALARNDSRLRPPEGWFQRQLAKGKCVVLFDGLDEVGDLESRRKLSLWLDRQIARYPRSRFILSSRPQGYRDAPLTRADVLEVLLLKPTQVQRFVNQWYLANTIRSAGGIRDNRSRVRATREADDLLRRLRAAPAIEGLTTNPLLLTMVAMVHRYRGALPGSRAELYEEICEVLLGRWRQAKGIEENVKTEQKRLVLQVLAQHMMNGRLRDISSSAALEVIAEPLGRIGQEISERFLTYVQDSSGLLQEKEAGRWTFAHLTFQEYLTSVQWVRQPRDHPWNDMVRDSWWHETLLLYSSKSDGTPIVRACLDVGTVQAFVLAAECLEEAVEVDVATRRDALQWLDLTLESAEEAKRHMAADVKLRRRGKELLRVFPDQNARIDGTFITSAEYEMFLSVVPSAVAPQHWIDRHAPAGERRRPVGGISPNDAKAFCGFVSRHDTTHAHYRLPTTDEAQAIAPTVGNVGTWATSPDAGTRHETIVLHGLSADLRTRLERELRARHVDPEPMPPMSDFGAFDYDLITPRLALRDTDRALKQSLDCTSRGLVTSFVSALFSGDRDRHRSLRAAARNAAISLSSSARESLNMTQSISKALDRLGPALTRRGFEGAERAVAELHSATTSEPVFRMVRLLSDLVRTAMVEDPSEALACGRNSLARAFLYLYVGYGELRAPAGMGKFLAADYAVEIERVCEWYWYLRAVDGWASGAFETWDGIRVVRDFERA